MRFGWEIMRRSLTSVCRIVVVPVWEGMSGSTVSIGLITRPSLIDLTMATSDVSGRATMFRTSLIEASSASTAIASPTVASTSAASPTAIESSSLG